MTLKNKIVFITGASSGIGSACAKIFAEQGARLLLCARRIEKLEKLAEQLRNQHNIANYCFQLDVSKSKAVKEAFAKLPVDWQNVDVLINNAGLSLGLDKMQDGNTDDWEQMIDTNIKGLLYITRAVLPNMVQRNQGHIINIGSISGHEVYFGGIVYCATKFAVNAITKGLKKELVGTNIRVTSIDPGAVETEFSQVRFKGDAQRAKAAYQGFQPLMPEDIADAVCYCASRPPHVNIREILILPNAQASVEILHKDKSPD